MSEAVSTHRRRPFHGVWAAGFQPGCRSCFKRRPAVSTGAYAHSSSEEMVRLECQDEAGLTAFMADHCATACRWELPALRLQLRRADTNNCSRLDRELHAWKISAEARSASIQIGARRTGRCASKRNAALSAYDSYPKQTWARSSPHCHGAPGLVHSSCGSRSFFSWIPILCG